MIIHHQKEFVHVLKELAFRQLRELCDTFSSAKKLSS